MLSPFPGMDPFLEEPTEWSEVHTWLITSISSQLSEVVLPNFLVRIEQRVYLTVPDDVESRQQIVPDVYLVKEPQPIMATSGAIAPATVIEPSYELQIRDRYIEIRDSRNREVITVIELLSPFNKAVGALGYEAFQKKRRQVFNSKTHWIEIDLLRVGERPREVAGKSDYYALLKRAGEYRFEVWYFDLRDRMPTIAVPLRPPFEDVPLNLQAAFNDTYRRAHYAESIDYGNNVPLPPLRPADVAWVQAQIEEWRAKSAR
ncbi:MAG TPA: DUF4058 family protein [Anaerolineae bacterium]